MDNILEQIEKIGIIPVVVIDRAEDAVPLAKALCEGGLPAAEVTFRTAAAKDAIKEISREFPDMLVGAGTVLTTEQADTAVSAGAKFIVSPGLNPAVVKHCIEKGVPVVPGCANASDIETALSLGLKTVKFFPAEPLGGLKMIKALAAPYVGVRFMPTGGLNAGNMSAYLDSPEIIACGGSFMVSKSLIEKGDFERVKKLTLEACELMLRFTFGGFAESHGHKLTVWKTANPMRAVFHLEQRGLSFDKGSGVYLGEKLVSMDSYVNGIRVAAI